MGNPSFLKETKQHGAVRFPFNIYPCTIPGDFPQVALHWQDSMELVFVKRGSGLVQMGTAAYPAHTGDIFVFSPLCSCRRLPAGDRGCEPCQGAGL